MKLVAGVMITSLGMVFVFAALSKIRHPRTFAEVIRGYDIFPRGLAPLLAVCVIGVECFLSLSFFSGYLLNAAIPLAAGTLVAFAVGVGVNLLRKRSVPCGCFGGAGERISSGTMTRLILLVGAIATLWVLTLTQPLRGIAPLASGDRGYTLEVVTTAVALTLLAMWGLALPQILSLLRANTHQDQTQPKPSVTGQLEGG
jgi:hypothetical protein